MSAQPLIRIDHSLLLGTSLKHALLHSIANSQQKSELLKLPGAIIYPIFNRFSFSTEKSLELIKTWKLVRGSSTIPLYHLFNLSWKAVLIQTAMLLVPKKMYMVEKYGEERLEVLL